MYGALYPNPADPHISPISTYCNVGSMASVTESQEKGRKLAFTEPQCVPDSGCNAFMDRRLVNPSNLSRGSGIIDEETEVL